MSIFLITLLLFVAMLSIIYFPVLYQHIVSKRAENRFHEEVSLLNDLYSDSLIVITNRLGEGASQNSDIKFSKAHENQSFAVNSILGLIDELGG